MQTPKIMAHRGGRMDYGPTENTVEAHVNVAGEGAHGVELDVFRTAAKIDPITHAVLEPETLVVFHDDFVNELTNVDELLARANADSGYRLDNVNGVDLTRLAALATADPKGRSRIRTTDLYLSEIQALRLKSNKDQNNQRYMTNYRIPTLGQVIDGIGRWREANSGSPNAKDFRINIEIKDVRDDNGSSLSIDLATPVLSTIDHYVNTPNWTMNNFMVSSNDLNSVITVTQQNAANELGLYVGYIGWSNREPWDVDLAYVQNVHRQLTNAGVKVNSVNLTLPSLTPEVCRYIRNNMGAEPNAWTFAEINPNYLSSDQRAALLTRLTDQANAIGYMMTDYPGITKSLLG